MRRTRFLTALSFLSIITLLATFPVPGGNSASNIRRITETSGEILNINPSLSGDGRVLTFESTADLLNTGGAQGFHAIRASLTTDSCVLLEIGRTRMIANGISHDGSAIAFSSMEDLVGLNPDRNSEIYLHTATGLRQITNTTPDSPSSRLSDGNFQPSISDDGQFLIFTSNRDPLTLNSDLNSEVFEFDIGGGSFTQLTDTRDVPGAINAQVSGDGSRVVYVNETLAERQLLQYQKSTRSVLTIASDDTLTLSYRRAISDNGSRVVYSLATLEHQSQVWLFDENNNRSRQITNLGSRTSDVPLNPTISGDGKRIAFATRRRVGASTDGGAELYLYDIPTAQFMQVTEAPGNATAAVVSSMNDDGTLVAFNFARVLTDSTSPDETANNSEIYVATIPPRPAFGPATVANAAAMGHEPVAAAPMPQGGIVVARGSALANETVHGKRSSGGLFPLSLAGTSATVNGVASQLLYVSPNEVQFVIPNESETGSAEVAITNSDGFISRSSISIERAAPGIFSKNGDGTEEGIILNSDSLLVGPFDPSNGQLRLAIFATGARNATTLSANIAGFPCVVESVHASADLPGLDEIRVSVPGILRGAGDVDLFLVADGRASNTVSVVLSGSSLRDVVINEFLADPPDGLEGDANHDGTRSAANDEFVELVNSTSRDVDLGGYQLKSRSSQVGATNVVRHRFPAGTVLPAGTSIVVFGGGSPNAGDPIFAGALVTKASSGGLSLANGGGVITLADTADSVVSFVTYGGSALPGDENQSLTRSPDLTGQLTQHKLAEGSNQRPFSPGTRVSGTPFFPTPVITSIVTFPNSTTLLVGQNQQFTAHAFDEHGTELNGVIFQWESSNPLIASLNITGLLSALRSGTAQVTAAARGVRSAPAAVSVVQPSPSPTPTPSTSPSPTPVQSPTPTPSPSPSPSPSSSPSPIPSPSPTPPPTPTPTPSPSPSPSPQLRVVVSEFRTRGPNGASDEFIELYNSSNSPIAIGGWKIKGSNNAGTISTRATVNQNTVLQPQSHFLLTNSSAYSGTVAGDQTYSSGIADDGGIAITDSADQVIDAVGMSLGSAFKEGDVLSPQTGTTNQSYERKPGGLAGSGQDTNDNAFDFQPLSPSDPQNASSPTPGPSPSPTQSPSPSPSPSPEASPSPSPTPSPTPVSQNEIVISQIYGGGGNSGAPLRNDFIELFNRGNNAVDLTGWSVQYAGATSSSWSVTNLGSVTLAPGQYLLIQEASGGSAGSPLPAPDSTGSINLASTAGKVALVNSLTALSGSCPPTTATIDRIGYGTTANCFEGAGPAPAPGNTIAVQRAGNGCVDTQNNAVDISTGAPTPRNSAHTPSLCQSTSVNRETEDGILRRWFVWLFLKSLELRI